MIVLLPNEIILKILSFLDVSDIKNVRSVSRRLHELCYNVCFLKKEVFIICKYNVNHLDDFIASNFNRIINLKVMVPNDEDLDGKSEFWKLYGPTVERIEILSNGYYPLLTYSICKNCPNLKYLVLTEYNLFDATKQLICNYSRSENSLRLPTLSLDLREFSIMGLCLTPPYVLNFIVPSSHCLRTLAINSTYSSDSFLVFRQIINLIHNQGLHLEELHLNFQDFTAANVMEILEGLNSMLSTLGLHTSNISNACLNKIRDKFKNLQIITLEGFSLHLSNVGWKQFFTNLQNLSHVSLNHLGPTLTDEVVSSLSKLPHLKCLQILGCRSITDNGIISIFGTKRWPKLTDLRLISIDRLTDRAILAIAPNLPNLCFLDLESCMQLTAKSINCITEHNQLLRHVSLHRIETGDQIINILNKLPYLTFLSISVPFNELLVLMSITLKTLYFLDMETIISDSNLFLLKTIFDSCPALQNIFLSSVSFDADNEVDSTMMLCKKSVAIDCMMKKHLFYSKKERPWCKLHHFYEEKM